MNKLKYSLFTTELHGVLKDEFENNSVTPFLLRVFQWLYYFFNTASQFKLAKIIFLLFLNPAFLSGQVMIRIFAEKQPGSVIIKVTEGEYRINTFTDTYNIVKKGEVVFIAKHKSKLAVRTAEGPAFICDSLILMGSSADASFSLRVNTQTPVIQYYKGDLKCIPDLGTMVFINIVDFDTYIAGVVKTEGGPGKTGEYLKTQAIIARTYMFKYYNKHIADGYNLCDNTHCQAFNGITDDSLIIVATEETKGQVILAKDSTLIIAAFHSNCGGETSPSENVWLTEQSYLKRVSDPYCMDSRNSRWRKGVSLDEWISYLNKSGLSDIPEKTSLLNFSQITRMNEYNIGPLSIPLTQIRSDMDLRSTFFSITAEKDSVVFNGRGYGHGVGLCQEGAMQMSLKGFDYRQIIDFYYTGVRIADISEAVRD